MLSLNNLIHRLACPCRTQFSRTFATSLVRSTDIEKTGESNTVPVPKKVEGNPIKFTTSQAHIDYKATINFYHDDTSLPRSHNLMLTSTGILAMFYLIFLRDDPDADGGFAHIKPVHEQIPEMAIPLLKSSIAENKKFGADTSKLERKLAEYEKLPEKHGLKKRKMVEN